MQGMATGAGHFSNMNIVRPERFAVVQAGGGTYRRCSAALPYTSRVVKTHHIFHPFTVVKRRLTVAVGTGYRQFIVRVRRARMFYRAYLRCPACDSQTGSIRITLLGDRQR